MANYWRGSHVCVAPNLIDVDPVESSFPSGAVMMWSGTSSTKPADWLMCDGSSYSRQTYKNLFNTIGTTFGAPVGLTANYGSSLSNSTYDMGFYADANPQIFDTLGIEVGSTFTISGGEAGFSNYTWTCTGINPSILSASATLFGIPVELPVPTGSAGVIQAQSPTEFKVPDFRGRSVRGAGLSTTWTGGGGTTGETQVFEGLYGGADAIKISADNLPPHKHGVFEGGQLAAVLAGNRTGTPNVDAGYFTIGQPAGNYTYNNATPPVLVSNSNVPITNAYSGINFIIKI